MKIVDASYEIMDRRNMSLSERIEMAGRMCYKSEERIEDGSADKFIHKMYVNKHYPVMEMSIIHIEVVSSINSITSFLDDLHQNDKFLHINTYKNDDKKPSMLITGSVRSLFDMMSLKVRRSVIMDTIRQTLLDNYPELFVSVEPVTALTFGDEVNVRLVDSDYIKSLPNEIREKHLFVAIKFITNRAVTHELVRHRPCSFLQESQRYCRYSHNKFGNEITFINPKVFFDEESPEYVLWKKSIQESEYTYMELLDSGATPQAARTVLPNSCKTEIIMFTNLIEWKHIFLMRTSKGAEPSMKELMIPCQKEMADMYHLFE